MKEYKEVEGIDANGKPCTFKIELPYQPKAELKLIESDTKVWWWNEYHYEYRGYELVEVYFDDSPECVHHSCEVYKDKKKIAQFNYGNCVEDAQNYCDKLLERKPRK